MNNHSNPGPQEDDLQHLRTLRDDLSASSRALSTRTAYATAWKSFETWTGHHRMNALPASCETLTLYLAHLVSKGKAATTLSRALTAIAQHHLEYGHPSPRLDPGVRRVLRGARRQVDTAPHPKTALALDDLRRLVAALGTNAKSIRDRALLLIGFAAGLRRSEIVALNVEDLRFDRDGVVVHLARSKTDPFGAGRRIRISPILGEGIRPLDSIQQWIDLRGTQEGPLFSSVLRSGRITGRRLSGRAVARIVKSVIQSVGLDPSNFAGHSLRIGCATTAARRGQSQREIAALLGHHTQTMAARYIHEVRFPSLRSGATLRSHEETTQEDQGASDLG